MPSLSPAGAPFETITEPVCAAREFELSSSLTLNCPRDRIDQ